MARLENSLKGTPTENVRHEDKLKSFFLLLFVVLFRGNGTVHIRVAVTHPTHTHPKPADMQATRKKRKTEINYTYKMLTKSLPLNFPTGMRNEWKPKCAVGTTTMASWLAATCGGDDDAKERFLHLLFSRSESEEMKTKPFPLSSTGNNNILYTKSSDKTVHRTKCHTV